MMKRIERLYGVEGGEVRVAAESAGDPAGTLTIRIDGIDHRFDVLSAEGGIVRIRDDGGAITVARVAVSDRKTWIQMDGRVHVLERRTEARRSKSATGGLGPVEAPMIGTVRKVLVRPGDLVGEGDGLVVVEAMKMEITLRSPAAARVADVRCVEGGRVDQGEALVVLVPPTLAPPATEEAPVDLPLA
jgi:biotin carboxyl carrier protein